MEKPKRDLPPEGTPFIKLPPPCYVLPTIHRFVEKTGIAKLGSIEGTAVNDILLDTGCSRTLVQKDFIPKEKLLEATLSLLVLLG